MKADQIFAAEVRKKRHEKHLSQTQLAARLGCSQAAICHVEKGKIGSLSEEKLDALCRELGVAIPSIVSSYSVLAFCGNPDCPLGRREVVNGILTVQPAMFRMETGEMRFCKACGKPLLTTCQEQGCNAPPQEGAGFCTKCGTALVKIEKHQRIGDLEEYKERMNRRCKEYREEGEKIEIL
ncbi:MAG: helix-turn-helix transcriptional regulator [Verrucomicrobiota bacterium]